jgi:RNA polymerase sigma-B factor
MTRSGQLGPEEVLELFRAYRRTEARHLRNRLIEQHRGLGLAIAADYSGRGVEDDDLRQIALLGILKAVERYDPERGIPFSSFASRTVNGEIKRWFRDRTWTVRPPRSAQERHLEVRKVTERLAHELGRAPTVSEIGKAINATDDEVLEALEASGAYRGASLDAPRGTTAEGESRTLADTLGDRESGFGLTETKMLVANLLERLPEREATILRLRFFEELTQSEIAEQVGISQMHVSRLLRRTLLQLRERIGASAAPDDD